jgi:hypothetical protein
VVGFLLYQTADGYALTESYVGSDDDGTDNGTYEESYCGADSTYHVTVGCAYRTDSRSDSATDYGSHSRVCESDECTHDVTEWGTLSVTN